MRVSRSFHDIAGRLLYRRLDLITLAPLLDLDKPVVARGWKQKKKPNLSRKKRLLLHVQVLDVERHFTFMREIPEVRQSLSTLTHLRSVRLNLGPDGWGQTHGSKSGIDGCGILSSICPSHLVIREAGLFQKISAIQDLPSGFLLAIRQFPCVLRVIRIKMGSYTEPYASTLSLSTNAVLDPATCRYFRRFL